jgi:hypothetical protein
MPPGRWDSACRRAGRRGKAGWRREGVVIAVVGEVAVGEIAIGASLWVVCGEAGHGMDSGAQTRGPALQMDMHEVGNEQSASCLVSDRGPRRERYSCSLPAETRCGWSWR